MAKDFPVLVTHTCPYSYADTTNVEERVMNQVTRSNHTVEKTLFKNIVIKYH